MRVAVLALIFACYHLAEGAHWALLVAGSRGYGNYRHQADICHSYQILRKLGIPADNIVTMMYDDIAHNRRNPFQGNIINVPGGPDVYQGVRIDYKGRAVTPSNFLKVLSGEATGEGNGRVIMSGPNDHIFVYFADHGNRNLLGFPHGVLYARQLKATLEGMFAKNQYEKMVIYIEACYSGTMFSDSLPANHNVFAITAANTHESSYAAYYDRERHTYLADEYSAQWMKDTETHNPSLETLYDQFINVKQNVHNSHVMVYGDVNGMGKMKVAEFEGTLGHSRLFKEDTTPLPPITDAVPSYDVAYMTLFNQLQDAATTEERLAILHEMQAELKAQSTIRTRVEGIVSMASSDFAYETRTKEQQQGCYEHAVEKYMETCKGFEEFDHNMKDVHVFSDLCNEGKSLESIDASIELICQA